MRWCCLPALIDQLDALQSALTDMPYALGKPLLMADMRRSLDDFCVEENLGFVPSGQGEHIFLQVQKRGMTTPALVQHISEVTGVPVRQISFAGLKDKYALTSQWLSLHSPGKDPAGLDRIGEHIENNAIQVLACTRNHKKLRRGTHAGNRFTLNLRSLRTLDPVGDMSAALSDLSCRLESIAAQGVPNYFGEQRFGYDNLRRALQPAEGSQRRVKRQQRGMQMSAVRSALFNLVLARRVQDQTWNHWLAGDVMNLDGTGSVFADDQEADKALLQDRVAMMDIHPTGPLWGQGELATTAEAARLEQDVAEHWSLLCEYLENAQQGLAQQRRSLRLPVQALHYRLQEDLSLSFELPVGAFATVVVRELLQANSHTG